MSRPVELACARVAGLRLAVGREDGDTGVSGSPSDSVTDRIWRESSLGGGACSGWRPVELARARVAGLRLAVGREARGDRRGADTMGIGSGELSVKELCDLITKIEAHAAKAEESKEARKSAVGLLGRVGKELRSKEVLAEAQKQAKCGKRLRKLTSHECKEVAQTAIRVLNEIKARVKESDDNKKVAEAVAAYKAKPRGPKETPKAKMELDAKSSSPAAARAKALGGGTGGAPAANADPVSRPRQVVRKALMEGLQVACEETGKDASLAEQIAVELENELHKKYNSEAGMVSKEYKLKYRSLSFNLKDKNNPDLRRRVLEGDIACKDIITWSVHQLASDKRKEDNIEIQKQNLLNASARAPTVSSTDQFKCGKCGKRKCTYYQMQTRSADEPMTTFVTCTNCNNRWKFS